MEGLVETVGMAAACNGFGLEFRASGLEMYRVLSLGSRLLFRSIYLDSERGNLNFWPRILALS